MAITNTTLASATFNGNGVTTAFATGFQFLANADLQVIVTSAAGVETVKVITTDYTVTGAGVSGGGTVTFLVAPATGEKVNIKSNVTIDQQTDYTEGGSFAANTHEMALDKLTKISQQIKEVTDRSFKLPISNQNIDTEISNPTANYVLRVNAAADAIEWASGASIGLTGAVTVPDADFVITDNGDATKKAQFELSGISTATTRTLTLQDTSGTVYVTGGSDVAVADGGTGSSTAAGARTNLGLGTIATQAASSVAITGGSITGITDLALADGGTGASLVDPNADRIMFWDDSAGAVTWLTAGSGLSITGTTIDASGGSGIAWSTPVDANIVPDANNTRSLGSSSNRFAATHTNALTVSATTTVSSILNESNMASNSATALATQQSIKSYVDTAVAGAGGGSLTLITSTNASAAASVAFTGLSSTYHAYLLVFDRIITSSDDVGVYLRTSTNNGSSYDSGAGDYQYIVDSSRASTTSYVAAEIANSSATEIRLNPAGGSVGLGNATNETMSGHVIIYDPSNTAYTFVTGQVAFLNAVTSVTHAAVYGLRATTTAVNAMQIILSAGNISGTFRLYGIKDT